MTNFSMLLLLVFLAACQSSTGTPDSESNGTGTTSGGTTTTSGGAAGGVPAGWSFPTSTASVQYAFQGLAYNYVPVTGITPGGWTVTHSGPTWLSGVVNGTDLELSGIPDEQNTSYLPLVVTYTNGVVTHTHSFSLYVRGDVLSPYQWHLENDGASVFARNAGVADEDMDVQDAWDLGALGAGISVAISDTGLDIAHEDLLDNLLPGQHRNYKNGTAAAGYVGNPLHFGSFHGTAVTGIIGAVGWNGKGGLGIAPRARVAGFQFLDSNQNSARYVHQATGSFDIFNYSYGTGLNADLEDDALFIAQLRNGTSTGRNGLGFIYVKAAGNEYDWFCGTVPTMGASVYCLPQNANIPAENNSPYWMVVGASNAHGVKSSYSNAGSNIWVVAPGGEYGDTNPSIVTTDLSGCAAGKSTTTAGPYFYNEFETYDSGSAIFTTLNPQCSYTSMMNGSSAGTPMVSGVAALMLSANASLTWRDVKHIIAMTADRIDSGSSNSGHPHAAFDLPPTHVYEQGWVANNVGIFFHNWYGFGRVNAASAVTMAIDPTYVPLPALYESNPDFANPAHALTVNAAIPNGDETGVESTMTMNYGAGRIVESVQVKLSITHTRSGEVGVEITSPGTGTPASRTKSILLNINNALIHPSGSPGAADRDLEVILTTHAFYGEQANGDWTIKVIDGRAAGAYTGTLNSWSINLLGH